jgi:hypothetical protein
MLSARGAKISREIDALLGRLKSSATQNERELHKETRLTLILVGYVHPEQLLGGKAHIGDGQLDAINRL